MKNNVYSAPAPTSFAPFWARAVIAAGIAGFIAAPAGNVAWAYFDAAHLDQLLRLIDLTELHPGGALIALGLLVPAGVFGLIAFGAVAAGLRVLFDPLFSDPAEDQPTE